MKISRRASNSGSSGYRLLQRVTVGIGAGTWVALGVILLASRVLPLDWPARGSMEELCFVAALAACTVWALTARAGGAVWWQQLALAGMLLLPVPLVATRVSSAGLFGSGPHLAPAVGIDIATLTTSLALLALALALRGRHRSQLAERRASEQPEARDDNG